MAESRKRKLAETWAPLHATTDGVAKYGDDQVLSFKDWCEVNNISTRAGRRIWADPEARPILTKLTEKKSGVTVRNNRAWQRERSQ